MLDFHRLRCFAEVARVGSITRAAEVLGMEQPALSRQVKLLEHETGLRLFHRNGRGVALTEQGVNVLNRVQRLLVEAESAERDINALRTSRAAAVRLGLQPSLSQALGAAVIQRLRSAAPPVRLRVVEAAGPQLLNLLQAQEIDLALGYGLPAHEHGFSICVQEDELCLIGAAGDPELRDAPFPLSRLETLRLILPSRGLRIRDVIDSVFAKGDIHLSADIEVDAIAPIKEIAAAGKGYSLLPYPIVHREVTAGRLAVAWFDGTQSKTPLVLVRGSRRSLNAREQAVLDAIATEAAALQRKPT